MKQETELLHALSVQVKCIQIACILLFSIMMTAFSTEPIAVEGPGRKFKENGITMVQLRGTWREMGRQYGVLLKEELRQVLAFAERQATAESDAMLLPQGLPMGIDFLDQLFAGVGEGAGLTPRQLVRIVGVECAYLNAALYEHDEPTPDGRCTQVLFDGSRTKDGQLLLGRNYDWVASFSPLPIVLASFQPTDGSMGISCINYAGCLYMTTGMNSEGVYIGLNSGAYASAECNPAAHHNIWMLWMVLQQSKTAANAVKMIQSMQGAACYVICAADAKEGIVVEWDAKSTVTRTMPEKGFLVATNHFVQPGWKNLPTAEDGGAESSVARYVTMNDFAGKLQPGSCDMETLRNFLQIPCGKGGVRKDGTLFQVLAAPARRELCLCTRHHPQWVTFHPFKE